MSTNKLSGAQESNHLDGKNNLFFQCTKIYLFSMNAYSIFNYPKCFFSTKTAWILTRERNPEKDVLLKAYATFDKYNLDKAYLVRTNQKDCT